MRHLIPAICALLALGAAPSHAEDGTLIIAMGYIKPKLVWFDLQYKPVGESEAWLWKDPSVTFEGDNPDFVEQQEGDETGKVIVKKLKPGRYEFYKFLLQPPHCGGACMIGSPQHAFAVPFTIKPGEATYVGDFSSFAELLGDGSGGTLHLIVSDQQERDLPIVRKNFPNLGPVTIAVPDAATIGSSFIKAKNQP